MNIGIHQPDYIPWLGLFYKMYLSDVFIHLDDAQYSNEAAHNFNTIKTANGPLRLKFPVEQHMGDLINQVRPKLCKGKILQRDFSRAERCLHGRLCQCSRPQYRYQ